MVVIWVEDILLVFGYYWGFIGIKLCGLLEFLCEFKDIIDCLVVVGDFCGVVE